ncbi:unnamed protein product [Ascophyllum nodosum]
MFISSSISLVDIYQRMHPFYKKASLPCGISRTVVSGKLVCILASVASNGGLRNTRLLDIIAASKMDGGGEHFVFPEYSYTAASPREHLEPNCSYIFGPDDDRFSGQA